MLSTLKYIWEEFKKKPFMAITFASIVCAGYFCYLYIDTFKKAEVRRELFERKIEKKDSIILELTSKFAETKAINDFKEKTVNK